jgi:[citrate (pro-3S)-lyase] ligase
MELDLLLFATRIAPHFHIRTRFVGSEPFSPTTDAYNQAMHRLLPPAGIGVREIERKTADGTAISASRVRDLLLRGELEGIAELVPVTTLDFLLSSEGIKIWTKG